MALAGGQVPASGWSMKLRATRLGLAFRAQRRSAMKTIDNLAVAGRHVLVGADLNVPLGGGRDRGRRPHQG
jgi:hypothetical protein